MVPIRRCSAWLGGRRTASRARRSAARSNARRRRATPPSAWCWISSRLSRSGASRSVRVTLRRDLGRGERIEDRAAGGAEDLDRRPAGPRLPDQPAERYGQQAGGTVERVRAERREQGVERAALLGRRRPARALAGRRRSAHKRNRRRRSAWPPPRPGSGGAARSARTCAAVRDRLARIERGRAEARHRGGAHLPSSAAARRPDRHSRPTGCRTAGRTPAGGHRRRRRSAAPRRSAACHARPRASASVRAP